MFQSCAHHTLAHLVTCVFLLLFGSFSFRAAPKRFTMPPSVGDWICATPPSTSSASASTSASGSASSTASTGTETAPTQLDHDEELWDALCQGVEDARLPDALPAASPSSQDRPIDEAGAGRPAARSLQAELAMAALGEPVAPAADAEPMMPFSQDGELDAAGEAEFAFSGPFRLMYNKFLSRYRRWASTKTAELHGRALVRSRASYRLTDKSPEARIRLARLFWADRPMSDEDKAEILAYWQAKQDKKGKGVWLCARAGFLTYNGDFGLMSSISVPAVPEVEKNEEVKLVVEQCRKNDYLREAWTSFQVFWTQTAAQWGWSEYALAFEICTHSLETSRTVRVHAHASIRSPVKKKVCSPDTYAWRGSRPHLANHLSTGRQRASGDNQSMYYLQCPKLGSVFSSGSVEPFQTYLVSGEWVFNLVQAGKMEIEAARSEIIKSAKNLPRLLGNLDKLAQELKEQRLRKQIALIEQQLELQARPFKTIPAVDSWKAEHAQPRPRYRFLVLVGPSGVGKTQFAKSLVPKGRSLELNMAAAPEPNLKEYDHELHDLILFDECKAETVLRQKKLFQAPLSPISLGQSTTGCFAYEVWMHAKLLVVASNVWLAELQALRKADHDWLVVNSVLIDVQEPLWLQ